MSALYFDAMTNRYRDERGRFVAVRASTHHIRRAPAIPQPQPLHGSTRNTTGNWFTKPEYPPSIWERFVFLVHLELWWEAELSAVTSRDLFLALAEVLDLPRECVSMEIKLRVNAPVSIRLECQLPAEVIGRIDGPMVVDCINGVATTFADYELTKKKATA